LSWCDYACPGCGAPLIRDRHGLERSTQVGFTRLAHIGRRSRVNPRSVSAEKQENTGMGPTSAALAAVLCKPHPEEARSAVSKDEASDPFALMLRDASQRGSAVEGSAPLSRCDAPQHEGRRALRILAKRTQLQILAKRSQASFASSPRKRGPMIAGRCSWVPALAALGRDDN
jgi:hypothetical protein